MWAILGTFACYIAAIWLLCEFIQCLIGRVAPASALCCENQLRLLYRIGYYYTSQKPYQK